MIMWLRTVRRSADCVSAPGTAVPGRGRHPRAHPGGPGRKLPGTARRRRGRRGVAPAALGRKLAITVEPLRELTALQRRQLDDEAGLLGPGMEATATLTVGTVRAGPHA